MNITDLLPKPDLLACRRLLCIQPHPDDIDICAGSTIARLADQGVEIHYLTVTDGAAGFPALNRPTKQERIEIRRREQEKAKDVLGVKQNHWLTFPDAGDWSIYDARNEIVKVIRKVRPDFVMTLDPWLAYEAHQDHIKCGQAASEAVLLHDLPIAVDEQSTEGDTESFPIEGIAFCATVKPNTIIDCGDYQERKFKAIEAHQSQVDEEFLGLIKIYDDFRGKKLAEDYEFDCGEGFKILDPIYMLHVFPEATDY